MKRMIGLALLVFLGVLAWRIGGLLSSDAVGMAVGIVLGISAGLPTALLVLIIARRRDRQPEHDQAESWPPRQQLHSYPFQPPVIIVAGGQPQHMPPQGAASCFPAPDASAGNGALHPVRQFRIVGEQEEWMR